MSSRAWLATLAVHATALALLASLQTGPSPTGWSARRPVRYDVVELVDPPVSNASLGARTTPADDAKPRAPELEEPSSPAPETGAPQPDRSASSTGSPSATGAARSSGADAASSATPRLSADPAELPAHDPVENPASPSPGPIAAPLALTDLRASNAQPPAAVTSPRLTAPRHAVSAPASGDPGPVPPPDDAPQLTTAEDFGFVPNPDGTYTFEDPDPAVIFVATLLPDGRVRFRDKLHPGLDGIAITPVGIAVVLPGYKHIASVVNGVELWNRRKRRLLARTRKLRLHMAVDFARRNIDRQLAQLYRDLLAIWTSDGPPPGRRVRIFETWDDCEETLDVRLRGFEKAATSTLDELRRSAGTRARKRVIAFVQRHIPADSVDAYTTAELRSMNARRQSTARFDPYGAPSDPP